MKELIGRCHECGKNVYCENGFFDGVHQDGRLICYTCAEESKKIQDNKEK